MFMNRLVRPLLAAAIVGAGALASLSSIPARAEMSAEQKAEIQAIVKDYLVNNPEVLRDAMVELDRRDQAKAAAAQSDALNALSPEIFNSPHQMVAGNPNGKITLVEFFDYNCPHCRNIVSDLDKAMKANPDFRVVLKDFPILTPESEQVARIAIALRSQFKPDKMWKFHLEMMQSRGLVDQPRALAVAKELGADMNQLNKDLNGPEVPATLNEVKNLAQALNADGTPTFVIGSSVISGEQNLDQLTSLIDNMRQCGKTSCV
ncbi:MAG TPA: DsbA family protein [Beijerinckiaceae bacterium]|nr:DsbA family protein [Beijerinckiaceae bacterium]